MKRPVRRYAKSRDRTPPAARDLGRCAAMVVALTQEHQSLRQPRVGRVVVEAVRLLDAARTLVRPAPDLRTPLAGQSSDQDEGLDFTTFAMVRDAMQVLNTALTRCEEITRNPSRSHNLELIAIDFLATNDWGKAKDPRTRLRYLAKMERLMGVRIVAFSAEEERAVYVSPRFNPSFWTS